MFGRGGKRRGAPERLRATAERESQAAIRLMQTRQSGPALEHSRAAERAVRALLDAEPDEPRHQMVLGSVLYNQAAIIDMGGGSPTDAVRAAEGALAAYESLIPGVGPREAAADALRAVRGGPAPSGAPADVHEIALYAADVKARLCGLLAKAHGADALADVHRLGQEAVETYEAVAYFFERYPTGPDRVRSMYLDAVARALPPQPLQDVTHLRGLAKFRVPADWTVTSADGVTTVVAPGRGVLTLRARIHDKDPRLPGYPGIDLGGGRTLDMKDMPEPTPDRPAGRLRRWDFVQPLDGGQARVFRFTFEYTQDPRHVEALAVLDHEIRATELAPHGD